MEMTPEFYKTLLDHLTEAVYFVDSERRILYWNRAAELLTGYAADEVLGSHCYDDILQHVDTEYRSLCKKHCPLHATMQTGQSSEARVFLRHKDGTRIPVAVRVAPIRNGQGTVIGAVEVFSDASASLEVERVTASLRQQIRMDPLTKVPNRRAMLEALELELQRFRRYGTPFSLVFVDIDHFKQVNDTHGHLVGDRALQWLVQNLEMGLRKVDLFGRYGGEEFLLIITASGSETAHEVAERLRRHLEQKPFPETGAPLTASFGIATVRPGDTTESLLDRADTALYASKQQGRNRVTLAD